MVVVERFEKKNIDNDLVGDVDVRDFDRQKNVAVHKCAFSPICRLCH